MIEVNDLQKRMQEISKLSVRLNHEPFIILARFLSERMARPESFVVMLGETSSGKTTLLNGLLGKEFLKTSARPTTGTIVEMMDMGNGSSDQQEEAYYAVNRNATLEEISAPLFRELTLDPDDELLRLRVVLPAFPYGLKDMRLFDTPGYGSILEHHEIVLKEFIPNSDVIIYVVSHRIGFKENDHHFLKYVNELIDPDTEVILVINRVPEGVESNDPRIEEILGYAEDCLHRKLQCHLVRSSYSEGHPVLPSGVELWNDLSGRLRKEERGQALSRAFSSYQEDLLLEMKGHVEKQLLAIKMTEDEKLQMLDAIGPLLATEAIVTEKIRSVFGKLNAQMEKQFGKGMDNIIGQINDELDGVNKWVSKDECVGFIQNHMLPLHVKRETKIISNWIQDELERLDTEISSMLNTALIEFERKVLLQGEMYKPLLLNISNRIAHKAAGNALSSFFRQFGGAGGVGAGVANAAKKGLKHVGKLFGKTFSRDTHNALASFLKRIGATSTKAVATAAAVIVEGVFYMYDSLTWQSDLKKQARKALEGWRDETNPIVSKDLMQLMEHNLSSVSEFFGVYRDSMQMQEVEHDEDPQVLQELLDELDRSLQQIKVEV